jgi:hypothetical protein
MSKKFYFNTDNDECDLDPNGTELASVDQARRETIALMGELLKNGSGDILLRGGSLRVWVTDGAKGARRYSGFRYQRWMATRSKLTGITRPNCRRALPARGILERINLLLVQVLQPPLGVGNEFLELFRPAGGLQTSRAYEAG